MEHDRSMPTMERDRSMERDRLDPGRQWAPPTGADRDRFLRSLPAERDLLPSRSAPIRSPAVPRHATQTKLLFTVTRESQVSRAAFTFTVNHM